MTWIEPYYEEYSETIKTLERRKWTLSTGRFGELDLPTITLHSQRDINDMYRRRSYVYFGILLLLVALFLVVGFFTFR